MQSGKLSQCIYCISISFPVQFNVRKFKAGMVLYGHSDHINTVFDLYIFRYFFVGRIFGRDDQHLVQPKILKGSLPQDQMSVMDRVECPAKNSYFLHNPSEKPLP